MASIRSKRRMPPALAIKKIPPALAGFALTDAVDVDDVLTGATAFNNFDSQPVNALSSEPILDYVDAVDTAGDVIDAISVVDQASDAVDAVDVLDTIIDIFF